MPIVVNTKMNSIIDKFSDTKANNQRDRSLENGPHSRISQLNRNSIPHKVSSTMGTHNGK